MANAARQQGESHEDRVATELAGWIDRENDPVVRMAVFESLAELRGSSAAEAIRAGLEDDDSRVRIECCHAIGKRGEVENVAALAEVIHKDDQIDVRLAAVSALSHYKQPQAVSAMVRALEDEDPALQFRAVESLRQMTGVDLGNDVNRWIQFARGETPSPTPTPSLAERFRSLWVY
jgi:HEAT repeat protein